VGPPVTHGAGHTEPRRFTNDLKGLKNLTTIISSNGVKGGGVGGRDRGVRPPEPSTHQPYQTVAHDPYAAFPSPYSAPAALRVLEGGGGQVEPFPPFRLDVRTGTVAQDRSPEIR